MRPITDEKVQPLPLAKEHGSKEVEERRIFYDYSKRNRFKRPVRIEMTNAKDVIRNECDQHRDCGDRYLCCNKRWCDRSRECGMARFCLPACHLTKMTYLSSMGVRGMPLFDLVYD